MRPHGRMTTPPCARALASYRGSDHAGAIEELMPACSRRGGSSTASKCSGSGARRASGSPSAGESVNASETRPSRPIGFRAERPNEVWALDFQFDQTADGRILKLLHVVDEHTREALAIECRRRIDADATVAVLDRLVAARGRAPEHVRCDNGPELTANALRGWVASRGPARVTSSQARRGPGPRRGLAGRLQHRAPSLGAWHDGAGSLRRQLAANRPTDQATLIGGGPMRGVRSGVLERRSRDRHNKPGFAPPSALPARPKPPPGGR